MPPSKNALLRYAAVDSCLQRTGRTWRFADLLAAVSAAYNEYSGSVEGVSVRSLREDLRNMRPGGGAGYNAPILFDAERGYYYGVPNYSIFNSPLTVDDLGVLQQSVRTLRQLQGLGLSAELTGLVQRIELRLSQPAPEGVPVICQFEQPVDYHGGHWLEKLYTAIKSHQVLRLTYQPFHAAEAQAEIVHPHLLKQYNGRWFLIGQRDGNRLGASVYALDRLLAVEPTSLTYVSSERDPTTYFDQLIGVSILPSAELEEIRLRFAKSRLPYILTKPLHRSQQVDETPTGPLVILQLIPTRELITMLLSFGGDVEVIAPVPLREQLRNELLRSLSHYEVG